jgi:aminoglycoside phosphotransferase (APT) family kinase protein
VTAGATEARDLRTNASSPAGAELEAWLLAECVPGWEDVRIALATRPDGGNSYETWFLDLEESAPGGRRQRVVLRREPARGPVEPYDISHEARVLAGLQDTVVPVPRLLGHCSDPAVAQRPFIVLENVAGEVPDYRAVTTHPDWIDPQGRSDMTRQFVDTLVGIQSVDWRAPAFGSVFDAGSSLRERLVAQIDQQVSVADQRIRAGWPPVPAFRDAAGWLRRNVPDADPADLVLVHGDYRIGNFIWRDRRIEAMLDWEGATVGDPMQDLGYTCHNVMREQDPELMAMLAPLDEYLAAYERASGRAVDRRRLHYFVIFALFYHLWTQLVALPSVVEGDAKLRILNVYNKPSLTGNYLAAQIQAYEDGRDVL